MPVSETVRVLLFWIAAASLVVAQAALTAMTLRAPPRAAPGAAGPRARWGEVAMVLAPAALTAALLALAWRSV